METVRVGMREFRDNMAAYVLEAEAPVAITRHGDTIGYFIPARKKRSQEEKQALREAADQFQQMMADKGVTEEDFMDEIKLLRAAKRG